MAESRGGKEDRRLKKSFVALWENGTDYVAPERLQNVLTSKELKVRPKANNITGLQLADLLAHPSRNEILIEQGLLANPPAPFAERIVAILQTKYDENEKGGCSARSFCSQKKGPFGPRWLSPSTSRSMDYHKDTRQSLPRQAENRRKTEKTEWTRDRLVIC